ncbi:MAG TPA: efflux RND transporter periplasmic adaptor subunit [Rhizomicrobium sp.]|jgi:RND family efflux transporter MFP subunit|nr:efflux RND transporter periplasmic adaptor subunit [Rhizomicrobium sp.]
MFPENDRNLMRRNLRRMAIGGGCVLVAIVIVGSYTRFVQASNLKTWTAATEIPTVALLSPDASGKGQPLVLPGTLQAYYDAQIYSRVPGYVHAWYKDIGAHVKQGELLATIDTPELDQQISQARADLGEAVAAQKLSATTAGRWESLLPLDAVSKQDVEEKEEDLASKSGAVKAAQANLDRLLAMKQFARITAPFDGVVTKRTADIGALVNAGPASNGDPLFAVADTHALRVYVNVPQSYSARIVPGMTASLTLPEYSGRHFPAKLLSTSNAISAQSSSLLVEFEAQNPDGLLKPGEYAQVSMGNAAGVQSLRLPASALIFRAAGLEVATLGPGNRIVMKPIAIGTDMGTQVTVASGLSPHDRVVDNPPDSLANGDKVRIGTTNAD